jgi:hypothetical protein
MTLSTQLGMGRSPAQRSPGLRHQALDAPGLEGSQPAVNRGHRATGLGAGSCDPQLGGHANRSHPSPDLSKTRSRSVVQRSAILGREEEKARALLVPVTPNESTRVRQCCGVGLRHAGTLLPAFSYVCGSSTRGSTSATRSSSRQTGGSSPVPSTRSTASSTRTAPGARAGGPAQAGRGGAHSRPVLGRGDRTRHGERRGGPRTRHPAAREPWQRRPGLPRPGCQQPWSRC